MRVTGHPEMKGEKAEKIGRRIDTSLESLVRKRNGSTPYLEPANFTAIPLNEAENTLVQGLATAVDEGKHK